MTYRRDRSIREVYEDRFMQERPGPYPRAAGAVERRGPFGRPEDEYGRGGYEYEGGPRFYPNGGGPRGFHDDQRGYQVEGHHFPERRAIPPARREDFPYRVPREDPHAGRSLEFGARAPPPPSVRSQGVYPAARSLPESGEDTLVQAIRNLDRGEERDPYRRKAALFPPLRERSPVRREVARSPHSRSGSSVSSRGYSPDRAKNLPFSTQQGKNKIPGLSREGSPQSATSNKEESNPPEAEKEEPIVAPVTEDSKKSTENLEERRTMAIAAKAKEIEKVDTYGSMRNDSGLNFSNVKPIRIYAKPCLPVLIQLEMSHVSIFIGITLAKTLLWLLSVGLCIAVLCQLNKKVDTPNVVYSREAKAGSYDILNDAQEPSLKTE